MNRRLVLFLIMFATLPILGQTSTPTAMENYLSRLPSLALQENGPQRYVFTCDYLYFDLMGNMTRKQRVMGDYTRGLPEGKAQWNNVRIAQATNFEDVFPEGEPQRYMDGFSYKPSDTNQFNGSFFAGFPDNVQTKTLVWDVSMFELFAWKYFDSLRLNEPYQLRPSEISFPGGRFHNRHPVLTWVGVSKMNGKMCAVIQYRVLFNNLALSSKGQALKGRSDYWGTIWVSLTDKQIENGTLNEEVLLGFEIPGQSGKQAVSIFRQATFQRKRL